MSNQPTSTSTLTQSTLNPTKATLSPPERRQPHTPPPHTEDSTDTEMESTTRPEQSLKMQNGNTMKMRSGGVDDLAICASPADYIKQRKRRNGAGESLATVLRRAAVDHQLGLSINLILFLGLSYVLFPSLRPQLEGSFRMSYARAATTSTTTALYGQGTKDLQLVLSFIILFTGLRAFLLEHVLTPLAAFMGITNTKARVRFAEQGFLLVYYCFYWAWGVYLFVHGTPPLSPKTNGLFSTIDQLLISLWHSFPILHLEAGMKLYYLSQLAFWLQQILVIHLEERRKDHYQMLTHHLITVTLMATSYGYRQVRVGCAVLMCMDVVDLVFPLAKILKYLNYQAACDAAFALFVVLWLAARHIAYLSICWSIYAHVANVTMPYGTYSLTQPAATPVAPGFEAGGLQLFSDGGPDTWRHVFQPFLDPDAETIGFNEKIRFGFLGLLLGLQCITLMWFVMICRVVVKVLRGEGADDTRSDDEDEGADIEDLEDGHEGNAALNIRDEKQEFIEVEASSTEMTYPTSSPRRSGSGSKRKSGFSSGLNLGERKEILNRIGCLSEEQLAREREKAGSSPARR